MFRFVDHAADLAVEIEAAHRAEFYRTALEALFALLKGSNEPTESEPSLSYQRTLEVEGFDDEELLVNLLNRVIFEIQTSYAFPHKITHVQINDNRIQVRFSLLPQDAQHLPVHDIKAATYHQLRILRQPLWKTKIVFDV